MNPPAHDRVGPRRRGRTFEPPNTGTGGSIRVRARRLAAPRWSSATIPAVQWGGVAAAAVEALMPGLCPHCGEALRGTERGLCTVCWSRMAPRAGAACARCAAPLGDPEDPCLHCAQFQPPQSATVVWGEHDGPLRTAVLAAKHGHRDDLVAPLARRLAATIAATAWAGDTNLVCWVSSHPVRRLRRPWSTAQLLARGVAGALELPVRHVLRRRDLGRQVLRTRARRLQLPGSAFRSRRLGGSPSVLVVDDVVTTGTTLRRAAAALHRAGAGEVYCAALARTPDSRSFA
jgi:predicted amidophosphoribosyltransferase